MKTLKPLLLLTLFLNIGTLLAQESNGEQKTEMNEIDKANKAINDANTSIKNTNESVKNTVDSSKETIATIGTIFGSGKKKKKEKNKSNITIGIQQVTYDNENLNSLYNHISKTKGVKAPVKKYSNGSALITVDFKESADALWQSIPKNVRSSFKMIEISDNNIVVQFFDN